MPTTKTLRFDMIALDTEFTLPEQFGETVLIKKANLSARRTDLPGGWQSSKAIPVSAATKVNISIPDPTPEEIAAKEAEAKAWTEKWYRRRLTTEIEACEVRIARFTERLATNPYDAFEWGTDTAIAAGKLRAYQSIAHLFDEKGYEAAKAFALRRTVEGAKFPQHSTAALSNLVKESETAGYAEFVMYE